MTERRKVFQILGNLGGLDSRYGEKPISELIEYIQDEIKRNNATHYDVDYIYDGDEGGYAIHLYRERLETDDEYNSRIESEKSDELRRRQFLEQQAADEIRLMHQLKKKYPTQW